MIPGIQAAISGLQAYSLKTQARANNIANLNTDGFKGDVVTLSSQAPQGVVATVGKNLSPGGLVPEATNGGEKMVEQSNVDVDQEIPGLMADTISFGANLKTLQAEDQMAQALIDLKA